MNKKTVIIIPNEFIFNINPFFYKCDQYHIEGFNKFIYQNDLSISSPLLRNSDKISKELADQGFVVMLVDNFYQEKEYIKNLVIYIPEKISKKQFEYFKENKKEIENHNLMVMLTDESKKFKFLDQTTTDNPIIDELSAILNDRLINNKIKKLITKK